MLLISETIDTILFDPSVPIKTMSNCGAYRFALGKHKSARQFRLAQYLVEYESVARPNIRHLDNNIPA